MKCTRCGKSLFKALTYSGTGSKVIRNISVPNGNFFITVKASLSDDYASNIFVRINHVDGRSAANIIDTVFEGSPKEKMEAFQGPMNGGFLEITADSSLKWTITIEAA